MHHRMLVTMALPDGATSEEARQAVSDTLMNDASFCGSGGRFGAPLCDWFVIGGRWSGLLAETIMGETFRDAVIARFPEMHQHWWPESLASNHSQELDSIWQAHGGTGPSPYTRDGYQDFPDDAMIITSRLYDALLVEFQGDEVCDGFADLDYEPLQPDFVGRKWLVVVDYHN